MYYTYAWFAVIHIKPRAMTIQTHTHTHTGDPLDLAGGISVLPL
jgi:hypothetical protein